MTTTKNLIIGMGMVSFVALFALPVSAQTTNPSANLSSVISNSDQAIAARIADLNTLNVKINAMKNVLAAEKSNTSSEVTAQINGLKALQAKIDADTDISTARTDAQSIFTSYGIYALVIPRGYLLVSADRISTIGTLMTALATKLEGRSAQASVAGGTNISGNPKIFADITAKITDADAHATLAENGITFLTPDNGNATTASTNRSALFAARANIAISVRDLKAARDDIQEIIQDLNISTTAKF